MNNDFLYMLGVVAVGFALNFGLRALPFLIFSSGSGEVPGWVKKSGDYVSPVIIAALIVYSYSGLEWKTAWPYLAGALTVAIQLWKRNPLASIVAGTVLYMCLVSCCGCVTTHEIEHELDHPLIRVSRNGILFRDRFVEPGDVPKLLAKHRVPKEATVYVLVDDDYDDQRALWVFKNNYLNRYGYSRSAWVHPRRLEAGSAAEVPHDARPVTIPYGDRTIRRRTMR